MAGILPIRVMFIPLLLAVWLETNPDYAQLDQVGQAYYNGIPTIQAKTELAMENVSGIMIWELGQDAFNEYSLLNVIDEVVNSTTNVANQMVDYGVVYSPNPFGTQLHLASNEDNLLQIQLVDINGRVLQADQLFDHSTLTLNTSNTQPPDFISFELRERKVCKRSN